jgi:hypothetical protein
MTIRLVLFIATLLVAAGCGRSPANVAGSYQTVGSEDKFRMGLALAADGQGKFATRANLGDPKLDRAVEATMTIPSGRWVLEKGDVVLTGTRPDGKTVTHRFFIQENGDLIWKENGARFAKAK